VNESRSNASAAYRILVGGPSGAALPVGSTRKGSLPPDIARGVGAAARYSNWPSRRASGGDRGAEGQPTTRLPHEGAGGWVDGWVDEKKI